MSGTHIQYHLEPCATIRLDRYRLLLPQVFVKMGHNVVNQVVVFGHLNNAQTMFGTLSVAQLGPSVPRPEMR